MNSLPAPIGALRPAQWVKNFVVFAPLVFAKRIFTPDGTLNTDDLLMATLGFALFCCASSAIYLFNDLRDRDNDRSHPLKRLRPIASGAVSPQLGWTLAVLLTAVALAASFLAPRAPMGFQTCIAGFVFLNILYSIGLKQVVIIDAMTLALGWVLRVLAGAAIIQVPASEWLLLCTLQLALFLAFAKRRHELVLLDDDAGEHREVLRHYSPYFLDQIITTVTASTLVTYLLYTISPDIQEKVGIRLIYTFPFVLYGLFRYLYLVHQKGAGGSPTRTLLTDGPVLIDVLLWIATTVAILHWS